MPGLFLNTEENHPLVAYGILPEWTGSLATEIKLQMLQLFLWNWPHSWSIMRRHEKNGHWGGETITWQSNAVPTSLLVTTDNLVDRKVKFSLILPSRQKNPNETQNKKWAKNIEGNPLNTWSHYKHNGLCRLRVGFSSSSRVQSDSTAPPPKYHLVTVVGPPWNRAHQWDQRVALTGSVPMGCALDEQRSVHLAAVKKKYGFHLP